MMTVMKIFRTLVVLVILGFVAVLVGTSSLYFYLRSELPAVSVLRDIRLQTPMQIFTQDGLLISQYGVKRRIPVTIDEVPEQLIQAILATEDSRFYQHEGIDPIGIARALVNLIATGEKGQGGSTLTMQLARGFFLTREKTYIRKVKEIFIAWHIEQTLSKDEILELYINKVELGHRAFGFGAAAQVYYGKDLNELTLAQIATLAGLPQAPSVLNPISRPERSVVRRKIVLGRMLQEGYIDSDTYRIARDAPVTASKHGAEIAFDAPYLGDLIYNEMIDIFGKDAAETNGYKVYATATSKLQKAAQDAVVQNLHDYDERHGYRGHLTHISALYAQWIANNADDTTLEEATNFDTSEVLEAATNSSSEAVSTAATNASNSVSEAELAVAREAALLTDLLSNKPQLITLLAELDVVDPNVPAVVLSVNEQSALVLTAFNQEVELSWPGIAWARPYINDQRQGPHPQTATDVVAPGDVVYVRETSEIGWSLSQIPEVSGAFVALDPNTGAVQAIVGGYSFDQSQFNRATQAKRQVGSNIKPFIYSAALENGYTLASVINDAPINQWDASSGVAWRPQNSPAVYDGPIRMRVALGKSKNVVSVRLLRGVGIENAARYLTNFGFVLDEIPRDETLSLGSGSHTPLEVANGFAVFSNGGYAVDPYFIDRITDAEGNVVWEAKPKVACIECLAEAEAIQTVGTEPVAIIDENDLAAALERELAALDEDDLAAKSEDYFQAPRVISEQNAFLVKHMLSSAVRANGSWNNKTYWLGTGWRARNILGRTDIGGKTGTTNDSRDTWFSGYAPGLVATSWVGFDDNQRQLGRTTRNQNLVNLNPEKFNWIGNALIGSEDGAKAAQPAWIRFMQVALADTPESPLVIPPGITQVRIDRTTGNLTQRSDHTSLFEYFAEGTEPTIMVRTDQVVDPLVTDGTKPKEQGDEIF
jgi:penicillin-binding protein 1A